MKKTRCDVVVVQVIVTEVDDLDRPVGELVCEPVKIWRATAREFWRTIDDRIDVMVKAREAAQPAAPPAEAPPPAPPAARRARGRA